VAASNNSLTAGETATSPIETGEDYNNDRTLHNSCAVSQMGYLTYVVWESNKLLSANSTHISNFTSMKSTERVCL